MKKSKRVLGSGASQLTPFHYAFVFGFGVLCFYIGRADSMAERLEEQRRYEARQNHQQQATNFASQIGNIEQAVENAGGELMEETSHLVHVALEKVERAFDDINANVEHYEPETPLPQVVGRPSKQLAELIVSVNSNDKITEQLKYQFDSATEATKPSLYFDYDRSSWDWQSFNFTRRVPNPNFIFHNKLPKSGSTTMVFLLDKLRVQNNFNLLKIEPSSIEGDKFHYEKPFINYMRKVKEEPLLLLKHHFIFDFAAHGMRQPTMINVVRDPVDWFVSQYYFRRNGWARSNEARKSMTTSDGQEGDDVTVDACVANDMPECFQPVYKYIQYFCGNHDECRTPVVNMKQRSNKRAKINVLRQFYVIGVMEQFEDTLEMFEHILPRFFTGISSLWSTQVVQKARNSTRTNNRKEISAVNRAKMANHALKWEMDLYLFIRALFNERLKRYNIQPHEIKSTR